MDLRIQRTKKAIIESFLQLLKARDFGEISISDIAASAQIARPTFYLHYHTKQDVLEEYLDGIFAQYMEEIHPILEKEDQIALAIALFTQVQKNAAYLYPLLKGNTVVIIQNKLHQYIKEVFGLLMNAQIGGRAVRISEHELSYIIAALAGMVYSVILAWMGRGMGDAPERMGKMLNRISRPGIVDLLKNGIN